MVYQLYRIIFHFLLYIDLMHCSFSLMLYHANININLQSTCYSSHEQSTSQSLCYFQFHSAVYVLFDDPLKTSWSNGLTNFSCSFYLSNTYIFIIKEHNQDSRNLFYSSKIITYLYISMNTTMHKHLSLDYIYTCKCITLYVIIWAPQ